MRRPAAHRRTAVIAVGVACGLAAGVAAVALTSDDDPGTPSSAGIRAPGVAVLASDGVVTRPDGSTVATGETRGYPQVTAFDDGRVVLVGAGRGSGSEVAVHDEEGAVVATYATGPEAVRLEQQAVAWVEPGGRLRVLASGTTEPLALPAPPSAFPDRTTFQGFVVSAVDCTGTPVACTVTVDYRKVPPELEDRATGAATLTVTEAGTTVDDVPELARDRTDVSADGSTWAVTTITPADTCTSLYDVATATTTARRCGGGLTETATFSPDGELVVTADAFGPSSELHVLDRDLRPLRTIAVPDGQLVVSHAWADDDSLVLAVVDEDAVVEPTGEDGAGGEYTWRLLDQPVDGGEPTVLAGPTLGGELDLDPLWVLGPGAG